MTNTTLPDQSKAIQPTRSNPHRGIAAYALALACGIAQAGPTVEFTAPADLDYPNASSYFNPVAPVSVLDVSAEIAPDGVRIETIPEAGVSILNPPDVVILTPTGEIGPLTPGSYSLDWTATTPEL